jgi:excisionase family DNA binding protein
MQTEKSIAERKWLTADEIGQQLAVSSRTVRRLADKGKIPELRVGRGRRFILADVEAALLREAALREEASA